VFRRSNRTLEKIAGVLDDSRRLRGLENNRDDCKRDDCSGDVECFVCRIYR